MNVQLKQLWELIKKSKFPKKLVIIVFVLSIIETLASLAVPLFTMNMINDFSTTGFAWTAVTAVALILV
ncbi:MAG: multidrug ABC transporter permease, partial [Solibacillus isronensis]